MAMVRRRAAAAGGAGSLSYIVGSLLPFGLTECRDLRRLSIPGHESFMTCAPRVRRRCCRK
jgi:hypothetical protein